MIRSEFRTLVKAYTEFEAQPYITADADWNTVINERLALYSFLTLALYDDTIDIITTGPSKAWLYGNPPIYSLMDDGFYNPDALGLSRRVFWPKQVVVGANNVLRNFAGRPGPITPREMNDQIPYSTATVLTAADILNWTMLPNYILRIFPKPDATFNNAGVVTGVIPGFYLHPSLTGDGQEVYLAQHHERAAAAFCAVGGLGPRASGSSLEKMQRLDSQAADFMQYEVMQARRLMNEELGYILPAPAAVAAGAAQ